MAKKQAAKKKSTKTTKTKTQAIKEFLDADPDASPSYISEQLAAQGMSATPGYVSTIKTNLKKRAGNGGRTSKASGRAAAGKAGSKMTLDQLLEAKKLAERLGGLDKAQQALNALSQLQ